MKLPYDPLEVMCTCVGTTYQMLVTNINSQQIFGPNAKRVGVIVVQDRFQPMAISFGTPLAVGGNSANAFRDVNNGSFRLSILDSGRLCQQAMFAQMLTQAGWLTVMELIASPESGYV